MCGRFALQVTWADLYDWFNLVRPESEGPTMPARYNIAPTQPIIAVQHGFDGGREGLLVRWGFIPAWVKDPGSFTLIINARSETAAEKPSFKNAIRRRRILIPATGFYEWQRFGKNRKSQPYFVKPANDEIVAFGGLLETWTGGDGSEVNTACIVTTEANENFAPIHHRLPLVIQPSDFDTWLNCRDNGLDAIAPLLKPVANDYFLPVPVSDSVNKVANAGPEVQEPVEVKDPPPEEPDEQFSLF
ncbi:MAG: SOS response-associated peptidase [Pseudomonadota bacterium]